MAEKKFKLVKNRIVGFCGYKRSGKGICAEALAGMKYVDVPFAGGLKAMLTAWLEYNGVTDTSLYTDDWYKDHKSRYFNNKEFRYAMQTLGTEWGRNIMGKQFWIEGWERRIAGMSRVAVSDVRFPDEVDAIREKNGIVIKVRRPSFRNLDTHESETNMESLKCDYEIVNIDIEDTQNQVREIVDNHFKGKGNFIRD
jgi:hypothetical protein